VRVIEASSDFETYLQTQERRTLLRFITCGSVDDGKSTLIGRPVRRARAGHHD
jgi:bifunctional enzyme CysN/CysC